MWTSEICTPLLTGKRYTPGQLLGISIVITGLAIKAKAVLDGGPTLPEGTAAATAFTLSCNVGRGLHSSTIQLNVSASCGTGGAIIGCSDGSLRVDRGFLEGV
jgi:hypothetical protein